MAKSGPQQSGFFVAPSTELDLQQFALTHDRVCTLNKVQLRFDPLSLPVGIDPYDEKSPCSSVSEFLEKRFDVPACQAEAPLAYALADSIGYYVTTKFTGQSKSSVPMVADGAKRILSLVKRPNKTAPANPQEAKGPGPTGSSEREQTRIEERLRQREKLLQTNPIFSTYEENPWMFVHWLDFPVVEIRRPNASQGDMVVYDRRGTTVLERFVFPVSKVRGEMKSSLKSRLRGENVAELEAIIGRNKRGLLSREPPG